MDDDLLRKEPISTESSNASVVTFLQGRPLLQDLSDLGLGGRPASRWRSFFSVPILLNIKKEYDGKSYTGNVPVGVITLAGIEEAKLDYRFHSLDLSEIDKLKTTLVAVGRSVLRRTLDSTSPLCYNSHIELNGKTTMIGPNFDRESNSERQHEELDSVTLASVVSSKELVSTEEAGSRQQGDESVLAKELGGTSVAVLERGRRIKRLEEIAKDAADINDRENALETEYLLEATLDS